MSLKQLNKTVEYSRPNENFQLLKYADESRLQEFFNDVTIKVHNKIFPAN